MPVAGVVTATVATNAFCAALLAASLSSRFPALRWRALLQPALVSALAALSAACAARLAHAFARWCATTLLSSSTWVAPWVADAASLGVGGCTGVLVFASVLILSGDPEFAPAVTEDAGRALARKMLPMLPMRLRRQGAEKESKSSGAEREDT